MKQLGKSLLSKAEECGISLDATERRIAEAKTRIRIADCDTVQAEAMGNALTKVVSEFFINVGCEAQSMIVAHVCKHITEVHGQLSVSEVKCAFDLFVTFQFAELQDLNHFGRVNPMYVSKILNHYTQFAQERLAKVVMAQLPEHEETIDPGESRRIAVTELAQDILKHGEKGLPKTMRDSRAFGWFVAAGLVEPIPNFSEDDKAGRVRLLRDSRKIGHLRLEQALSHGEGDLIREHIESEFQAMFWNFTVQEIHDKLINSIR